MGSGLPFETLDITGSVACPESIVATAARNRSCVYVPARNGLSLQHGSLLKAASQPESGYRTHVIEGPARLHGLPTVEPLSAGRD